MKKLTISLTAILLVLTLVVAAFGWPGFLLGLLEKGPAEHILTAEQTRTPEPVPEWVGDSAAFSITPVEGVTISAEENAMDEDRTFDVSELSEDEIDSVATPLVAESSETVYPLGGVHIDAGLGADGILPGFYTMKIDLAERGVPEDLWDQVSVWRRDDNGYYYEYSSELDGGVITIESKQNGVIFWVVSAGVVFLCSDVFFPAAGTGIEWFERANYIYVTEGDKPASKKVFKLKWSYSSGELEYIKRKADLLDKGRQKYKITEAREDFIKEKGTSPKTSEELMAYRVKYTEEVFMKGDDPIAVEYRKVCDEIKKIRASRSFTPEMVQEVSKRLMYAREYLKTLKIIIPTPCITVELVPKITATSAAGVTVAPIIFLSNYLVLQTEGLVSDPGKYDVLTTTAVHELFHICTACYKGQNSANLKINEATAQIVETDCGPWLLEKGYIKHIPGSENENRLETYGVPLDLYSVTYADGSKKEYKKADKSDTGYPLSYFLRYLMKRYPKTSSFGGEMHAVLTTYRLYSGTPTVSQFLKDCFGLTDESLTSSFILFARKNQAKFYEKAVKSWDDSDYTTRWAFPTTSTKDFESARIDLDDHNYTIRVRHLIPFDTDENTGDVSMLLVFDDDFTEKLPDTKLYPLGNTNYKKSKYGLFYNAMGPGSSEFFDCYMLEVDGGTGTAGAKSGYTMYSIESPETPELKVGDGLLTFTLPDMSHTMEDGYMDGFRTTIKCSDGTTTVNHYKRSGAGKEISIRLSNLHGALPEGTKEEDLTYSISVCEYINEKDRTRTYGPESESRRSEMDSLLDEMGALEGKITISLYWPTKDDLDLHCVTPDGSHIYYSEKEAGGGRLDVDMQIDGEADKGVENIYFDDPKDGEYQVYIVNYTDRSEGDTPAQIRIKVGDEIVLNKSVSVGSRSETWNFTYGRTPGEEQGGEHLD